MPHVTTVGWRGAWVRIIGPPDLTSDVVSHLPPFWSRAVTAPSGEAIDEVCVSTGSDGTQVAIPDGLSFTGPPGPPNVRAIASRIELAVVSRMRDVAPVHAGVVAWDNRAIILPGASMSGKSTLVRALLDAGAMYLSDEFALITPGGRVAPYPRLITIRTAGGSVRVAATRAAEAKAAPYPVSMVAELGWTPSDTALTDRSRAQTVLALIANSVTVRASPQLATTAFGAAVADARCLGGTRGEAADAAKTLLAELAR